MHFFKITLLLFYTISKNCSSLDKSQLHSFLCLYIQYNNTLNMDNKYTVCNCKLVLYMKIFSCLIWAWHPFNGNLYILRQIFFLKILHFHSNQIIFKGHLLCKIHFYMVFGHKCVLAVCEHDHPTMIKIHPFLIFQSPLNQVSLTRPAVFIVTSVWRHISEGRPRGLIDSPALL